MMGDLLLKEQAGSMVIHICDPSTWEVKARGSEVQHQPWLHIDFEASLSYIRTCLKISKAKKKKNPSL